MAVILKDFQRFIDPFIAAKKSHYNWSWMFLSSMMKNRIVISLELKFIVFNLRHNIYVLPCIIVRKTFNAHLKLSYWNFPLFFSCISFMLLFLTWKHVLYDLQRKNYYFKKHNVTCNHNRQIDCFFIWLFMLIPWNTQSQVLSHFLELYHCERLINRVFFYATFNITSSYIKPQNSIIKKGLVTLVQFCLTSYQLLVISRFVICLPK